MYDAFMKGPRAPVMAADVLRHTLALSCFVCCPLVSGESFMRAKSGDTDGGDRWRSSIISYYGSELGSGFNADKTGVFEHENIPGMRKEVPAYIESFIEMSRKGLPDLLEQEFPDDVEGANALMVYDFRQG